VIVVAGGVVVYRVLVGTGHRDVKHWHGIGGRVGHGEQTAPDGQGGHGGYVGQGGQMVQGLKVRASSSGDARTHCPVLKRSHEMSKLIWLRLMAC
jgi:hypothetical protein